MNHPDMPIWEKYTLTMATTSATGKQPKSTKALKTRLLCSPRIL